ncbi:hypothetical protein B0H16DRAFT_1487292 [Mycena metata]|uniref:Uncharacterized protein n=1 Tax=Mycena metata TaxID=1033252 RepID=A0AAD7DD88_9AGAR|nr:hypothetical protein B0H16DRAFT_1487292 [Mycena metata]
MGRSKVRQRRIPRANRKNLRLRAEGAREKILELHIAEYTDALERGWRQERECLQGICNEFHARISWRLQDHEEPDVVPDYDPRAPPPAEDLDEDDKKNKRKRVDVLNEAYQQYMHEAYETDIAALVAERWLARPSPGSNLQTQPKPTAAFRAEVARDLFAAFPEDERNGYAERAKEEAQQAREKYNTALKAPPSKKPEDRQRCIDELGNFLGPIQRGILELTGLHSVVLMGGPIPKYGGELQSVYSSYGRSRTAGKQHFPEWAGERWDAQVGQLMEEYLKGAFTEEDIKEAALPDVLENAKYTLDPDEGDNDDNSESDSNADSDDSDASPAPAKKKQKVAPQPGPAAAKPRGKKATKAPAPAQCSPTPELQLADLPMDEIIAQTLTGKTVTANTLAPRGLSYVKERNMARNKILLAALEAEIHQGMEDISGDGGEPVAGKKKRKSPKEATQDEGEEGEEGEVQRRKSRRLNGSEAPVTNPTPAPTATSTTAPSTTPTPAPAPTTTSTTAPSTTPVTNPTATSTTAPSTTTPAPAPTAISTTAPSTTPVTNPTATSTTAPSTTPMPAPALAAATTPTPAPAPTAAATPTPTRAAPTPTVAPAPTLTAAATPAPTAAATPMSAPGAPTPAATSTPRPTPAPTAAATPTPAPAPAPAAVVVEMPEDAPAWLRGCVAQLSRRDLGCHFTGLLETLVRLKTSFGFDDDTYETLPAEGRPKEVGDWIKGGRDRSSKVPPVKNLAKYIRQWNLWWGSLQPAWCRRDSDGNLMTGGNTEYGTTIGDS